MSTSFYLIDLILVGSIEKKNVSEGLNTAKQMI